MLAMLSAMLYIKTRFGWTKIIFAFRWRKFGIERQRDYSSPFIHTAVWGGPFTVQWGRER